MSDLGCRQSAHEHEIFVAANGLQLPLPSGWIQWNAEKLKSPEAVKAHLVAYAGDPEKKALVSVRRFLYQRFGARRAINSDTMDGLKPTDQSALFDVLAQQYQKDLSEGTEYFELVSSRHSEIQERSDLEAKSVGGYHLVKMRGYFLELIAQSRDPGEPTRWIKSVLVLPKKDDDLTEVRFSVPLSDKPKYQADLDFIDSRLQRWIQGSK